MEEITVTTKLKVFSIKDVFEVKKYIEEKGYFANSIEEFKYTSEMFCLDKIQISSNYDENVFVCEDGRYKLFAMIEG